MLRLLPVVTRTDTRCPYPTLFRFGPAAVRGRGCRGWRTGRPCPGLSFACRGNAKRPPVGAGGRGCGSLKGNMFRVSGEVKEKKHTKSAQVGAGQIGRAHV